MPDQTARDAVAPIVWRHGWVKQEADDFADAVLAVLGIPPEMATSEISAGLWLLAHADGVHVSRRPSRAWVARDRDRYWVRGVGASPAAAVLALANKLQEHK